MSAAIIWDTFWSEVGAGRVCLPVCSNCGRPNWYPTSHCRTCAGTDFRWDQLSGSAEVFLAMWVHRDFTEEARPVPYGVALVVPDEHPTVRLLARVVGDELPAAGQAVVFGVDGASGDPVVALRGGV